MFQEMMQDNFKKKTAFNKINEVAKRLDINE
jgi:hypothetical protein